MTKCYIAGKVTGLPEYIYVAKFRQAEIAVTILGYEPVNPVTLPHDHDRTWQSYMREAITAMMQCEAVYVLPGWETSKGACAEIDLAKALEMNIIYEKTAVYKPIQ
jgi:hypothetical protein